MGDLIARFGTGDLRIDFDPSSSPKNGVGAWGVEVL